ncbi:MAG: hypothetical protein M1821_001255 [Bathelium mastoideum]|nr:MAG: hypothetical protein M1821_001255 [Bathelium mastoideum]
MDTRRVLVIAGSDSSGGAGLEADQKVLAAHGCYAMTATTALTAQNTQGVPGIQETPAAFVKKQIDACLQDVGAHVIKIGMLASAGIIDVVADVLQQQPHIAVVLDPVMVSTSGAQLLPEGAVKNLRERLLPLTTILTPNIPEARLLLRDSGKSFGDVKGIDDIVALARTVQGLGSKYVLVKGGHLPVPKSASTATHAGEQTIVNVLVGEGKTVLFENEYLESRNTHGTGCSLASAIAANLTANLSVPGAVKKGCRYVEAGIRYSKDIGQGSGPINHFHSSYALPFSPGYFIEYLLDRNDVQEPWKNYTHHEFVRQLALGTLPPEAFRFYMIQDYLYLVHFSRAHALAAYKARALEDISTSASIVLHIREEMKLHLDYCREFGLSKEDVERQEESQACTAVSRCGRYFLDVGQSEDWLALQIALLPCLLGYGMIAERLHGDPETVKEGNRYQKWIQNYISEDFTQAVKTGSDLIEKNILKQSVSRVEELVKIFIHATKMETGFWDMASAA